MDWVLAHATAARLPRARRAGARARLAGRRSSPPAFAQLIEPVLEREGVGELELVSNEVDPDPDGLADHASSTRRSAVVRRGVQARVRAARSRTGARSSTSATATPTAAPPRTPTTSSRARGLARLPRARKVSLHALRRLPRHRRGRFRERSRRSGPTDPLELDPETMRALGYRAVDLLVDRIAGLDEGQRLARRDPGGDGGAPARAAARRADRRRRALPPARDRRAPVRRPARPSALLRLRAELPHLAGRSSGTSSRAARTSSRAPGSSRPGRARLELVVIDWFRQWLGWPPQTSGILVPGGSLANLTALALRARDAPAGGRPSDAVIYVSIAGPLVRHARVPGARLRAEQVRSIAVDEHLRMRPEALAAAIEADVAGGPAAVHWSSATAGTTNTGAVDPLDEIAAVCSRRTTSGCTWTPRTAASRCSPSAAAAWLAGHRPGGLGRRSTRTSGSTSRTSAAACSSATGPLLAQAFHVMPDYLQDTAVGGVDVNFADRGIQLTRAARALKLWLSLQYFGVDAFREAIDRSLDLAVHRAGAHRGLGGARAALAGDARRSSASAAGRPGWTTSPSSRR